MSKVWFITGCSSGFGQEIVRAALARGDKVIATARKISALEDLKQLGATTMALDITSSDDVVQSVVNEAIQLHGTIDILVNNAAYMILALIEECSHEEVLAQFNTNVFGGLKVTRAVLPVMRKQRSGVIANVGSKLGWFGTKMGGLYGATKFAIAGLTLALREEVAPFGIDVTVIEPGSFRTNCLGYRLNKPKHPIPELEEMTNPIRKLYESVDGKQVGDPAKGAQLIVEYLTRSGRCADMFKGDDRLPARFILGKDAVAQVREVLEQNRQTLENWAELTSTTDIDTAPSP